MKKQRIVIAIDKFKGSLTASQAADAIERGLLGGEEGLQEERSDHDENYCFEIVKLPMADGGEGSMDVVERAFLGAKREVIGSYDPLMREIDCEVLIIEGIYEEFIISEDKLDSCDREKPVVFIEMAKCCGLNLLGSHERNPLVTTTYGLGVLIKRSIERFNPSEIIIGIGGSATNDAGTGMLNALGYRFFDKSGKEIDCSKGASVISDICSIDSSGSFAGLYGVELRVASDVTNPLLGPNGATMVYGAQKGADPQTLKYLEDALSSFAELSSEKQRVEERDRGATTSFAEIKSLKKQGEEKPGAGAAGGVGFALMSFLNAKMQEGWRVFSEMLDLEGLISGSTLIITGEGKFDSQSLAGKLPWGIASLCKKYSKPLWLFCGVSEVEKAVYNEAGIERVYQLNDIEPDPQKSIRNAAALLEELANQAAISAAISILS